MAIEGISGILGGAIPPLPGADGKGGVPLSGAEGKGAIPLSGGQGLGPSFADTLKGAVVDANNKALVSDQAVQRLMVGEGSLHQTMIAMQDSGVAMDMVIAVRNKALEAYQEMMRMPV